MIDTPERIWAYHNGNSQTYLTAPNKFHNVEYVRADLYARLQEQVEALTRENAKLYDDHEARVFMHHKVEEHFDTLLGAARELIETVDGAYPGNAWTAEIKRTIWDVTNDANS